MERDEADETRKYVALLLESRRQETELQAGQEGIAAELEARLRGDDALLDAWCEEISKVKQKRKDDVLKVDTQLEMTSSDILEHPDSQIQQLREENEQLKRRVSYVQSLNSQWQKYDSSREDYIRGLCRRLKSAPTSEASAAALRREIVRLNASLEDKMDECARLRKEAREERERVRTLEQQAVIYAEDFRSERADRERAQGRVQELKEHICHLKQQLRQQEASRESAAVPLCRVHIGHRVTSSSRRRRAADATEVPSTPRCPRCSAASDQDDVRYFDDATW
ncbi:TNFAIP3-interacting protein 2 isoform X1 [Corythoichthys intestinalis]|uniref:TNFAIP3-interacting protein 2 isoform X1 n=1 Tax=Corythoichthys intestinalis TaxID=161448 RepID=UPI0025A5A636|nr:TNFAIP3-interacting protein 2 isoform X1 [Corythoichthys intestinalis]